MVPVGHLDELRGDPEPVARSLDAALQNGPRSEVPADLSHVAGFALVRERRGARHDIQPLHMRQLVGDLLADPVAQVFVVGDVAEVGERKDHDVGGLGRRSRNRSPPARGPAPPIRVAEVPGRTGDDGKEDDPRADDEVGCAVRQIEATRGPVGELEEAPAGGEVHADDLRNSTSQQFTYEFCGHRLLRREASDRRRRI